MEKLTARFTVKTLLVVTLIVAAYFAGRASNEGEINELEQQNVELNNQLDRARQTFRLRQPAAGLLRD